MYLLSVNGFYALGSGDSIVCVKCSFGIKDWIGYLDPISEHKSCKPNCIMTHENYLISGDEFSLSYSPEAYDEEYSDFQKRLKSFSNWAHQYPDSKSLSFAGLYFTNEEDFVRKFI